MKLWEIHGMRLGDAIRTTPEGSADIRGLVLSERAYVLVVRDFRPEVLIDLVAEHGALPAAQQIVAHYASDESLQATGGRGLVVIRDRSGGPGIYRSDELGEAELAGRRL